ncbi:MAG TPA: hypothetical protein VGL06_04075 [Pseudonocardiaceae bacterium]
MSGPYPPPGYPRPPDQGGWGDQPQQPYYDFPTVQYGGLANPQGGWGPPPRRPRNRGRMIVAAVSILVIIAGVVTGAVLLHQRHPQPAAAPPPPTTSPAPPPTTAQPTTTAPDDGLPNGNTVLHLATGACVSAQATANNQYRLGRQVACGTAQSDLVLAVVSPDMAGCADHEYLRVSAPSTGVYCFTLDVKQGDCVDSSFLKSPCAPGAFTVLRTEPGPGGSTSCTDTAGATHWVPVGRNPVAVACVGPARTF